jgi:ABC-type multidrug transport system fused ATPase/permease subunit
MMNFLAGQRWLGFRIEVMGASITTACSIIIILANDMLNINAGMVGLLLQWSIVFTSALNFFFLRLTDSEARLTSIERIYKTSQLESEAAWETDSSVTVLETSWPRHGELEFDNVCMRYRTDLPLALNSVSFKLTAKRRCGIIGRTGSGKTTLISSIFRITEIESGRILLDGVDLSKVGLSDVRGRAHGLRVIPQDPVLYAGTLRDCVDPFHLCADDEIILEALQAVKHQGALERGLLTLNDSIEEGGSNLSAGERQLLCLARAIVEKPRVLILDEATASVDSSTDSFIQEMLRSRFNDTTLLTIAHRLHTIMDYDTVLVMENGRVAQFGPPKELLKDKKGIFASLVNSSGPETARELRAIAEQH